MKLHYRRIVTTINIHEGNQHIFICKSSVINNGIQRSLVGAVRWTEITALLQFSHSPSPAEASCDASYQTESRWNVFERQQTSFSHMVGPEDSHPPRHQLSAQKAKAATAGMRDPRGCLSEEGLGVPWLLIGVRAALPAYPPAAVCPPTPAQLPRPLDLTCHLYPPIAHSAHTPWSTQKAPSWRRGGGATKFPRPCPAYP